FLQGSDENLQVNRVESTAYIPFNVPSIGDEEIGQVVSILRSGWLTTGLRTTQFGAQLKNYVQRRRRWE
ncbi:MAG TPA: hypothetical protein VHP35_02700, partial [Terriglobia bacterium]|nr:hypothetical protein [Terriglobia bacterium]